MIAGLIQAILRKVLGQTSPLQKQFQDLLRQSDDMLARKDVEGSMTKLTDDFQGQDIEGNVYDKYVARESLEKSISISQTLCSRTQLQGVTLFEGEATVLTKEHTELRIIGQKTGKIHSLIFRGTWRSIWVQEDNVWKVRSQKQLSQTITQNGVSRVVTPKG